MHPEAAKRPHLAPLTWGRITVPGAILRSEFSLARHALSDEQERFQRVVLRFILHTCAWAAGQPMGA